MKKRKRMKQKNLEKANEEETDCKERKLEK